MAKERISEKELINKLKQGDQKSRNTLIKYYMPSAEKIASEYFDLGLENEDIISSAFEGLLIGINTVVDINTYAKLQENIYLNIRINIEKAIAVEYGISYKEEKTRHIKINMLIKILKAKKELKLKLHHSPTVIEISNYLNLKVKSVEEINKIINFKSNIDISYIEITKEKNEIDLENEYLYKELLQEEKLTKLERKILYLRFYENMLPKEIALIINKHISYVRQIIKNALFKIRRINQVTTPIENEKRKILK